MDLNELSVSVVSALLIERGLRRSGADNGIGGLAEDGAAAAGGDDDGVGGEGADFHSAEVHGADAARDAASVEHGGKKLPVLVLIYFAFGLVAADLLVESVEKLLAGGGSGEGGAVVKSASEAAEIEQAFGRAIERDSHAVEQIDDAGSGFTHGLDGRLVGEEISTVDGVIEMLVGGVTFAFEVLGGIDSALSADGMRALDRDDGEQVDLAAHLSDLDDGGEASEASADYDDSWNCHL